VRGDVRLQIAGQHETREVVQHQNRVDADAARVRALAAYRDFLTLWKDADPDIPILLAMLFSCGFRRSELVGLELSEIQIRQVTGRWWI
jgi:integrase